MDVVDKIECVNSKGQNNLPEPALELERNWIIKYMNNGCQLTNTQVAIWLKAPTSSTPALQVPQDISDIEYDHAMDSYEISWKLNGEQRSEQFAEKYLLKLLKLAGVIDSHSTYRGEYFITVNKRQTALWVFMTECDLRALIIFIEKSYTA